MREIIEIRYSHNPRGQVGTRPRKIRLQDTFRFITNDPGVLTIEFTGETPLANNSKVVASDTDFAAARPGVYPFKCKLIHNGVATVFGDPADLVAVSGGELDVSSDPNA
jgi:hypothetical protein